MRIRKKVTANELQKLSAKGKDVRILKIFVVNCFAMLNLYVHDFKYFICHGMCL